MDFSSEPNFYSAKETPPAFAGLLVDWSIGPKEVTSTIIDLITRDFLGVSGNTLFITSKKTGLRKFEEKFIKAIFKDSQSLEFDEIQKIAYKEQLDPLMEIICKGFIEEGFLASDFQKKLVTAAKSAMKETLGQEFKMPSKVHVVKLPSWILRPLVSIAGFGIVESIEKKSLENLGGKSCEDALLTDRGKKAKADSITLKIFMEKYPMIEDRLANELVGQAIAFGIGKAWVKKLGGKNAVMGKLMENFWGPENTVTKFMNMDSYLKEFQS